MSELEKYNADGFIFIKFDDNLDKITKKKEEYEQYESNFSYYIKFNDVFQTYALLRKERYTPLFELCYGCREYDIIEGCDKEEKCKEELKAFYKLYKEKQLKEFNKNE